MSYKRGNQPEGLKGKIQSIVNANKRLNILLQADDPRKHMANMRDIRENTKKTIDEVFAEFQRKPNQGKNEPEWSQFQKAATTFSDLCESSVKFSSTTNYDNTSSNSRPNVTFNDDMKESLLLRPTVDEDQMMDTELLRQRQEEIENVQRDVQAIHGMFQDVHLLVLEQGEQLDLIDANLTSTLEQTVDAHTQLTEAEDYQRRSRRGKCCLMLIIAIVAGALAIGLWQVIS